MLSETLGKWHFWLFVIGFHLTFDTMHIPGLLGMPRRIYTYEADRGWELLNLICTVGVVFQAAAILIFLWNVIRSLALGQAAGNDPWDAWTLEWAVTSPPPPYNFATAAGRAQPPAALGLQASGRSGLEVPRDERAAALPVTAAVPEDWRLPDRGPVGMWCLIIAEAAIFTIFVVAYLFYLGKSVTGPEPRDVLELPIFISLCLWSSAHHRSSPCARCAGERSATVPLLWLATIVLAVVFSPAPGSSGSTSSSRRA